MRSSVRSRPAPPKSLLHIPIRPWVIPPSQLPLRDANRLRRGRESSARSGSSARSHHRFPPAESSPLRCSSAWLLPAAPAECAVGGGLAVVPWRGARAEVPCSSGVHRDHSVAEKHFLRRHSGRKALR